MRFPQEPPKLSALFDSEDAADTLLKIILVGIGPTQNGYYRHWDKLRFLEPPSELTQKEWWWGILLARQPHYKKLPLMDKVGNTFHYMRPDAMVEMLHFIDQQAGGVLRGNTIEPALSEHNRDQYIFKTLVEEAITSSQLEGAATTYKVAKDMLYRNRRPRNHDEQMIYNNYLAMQFIREIKNEKLTPEIVLELHRIVTQDTLEKTDAAGRLRAVEEDICIADKYGTVYHDPPHADELKKRMISMCSFANGDSDKEFIHPVVRAIFLHFWLAYDHPFVDGNGRTARALFYWSMISQDYWLCEYISISHFIKKAPSKYGRAFLYTETDNNDATYFLLNQLRLIVRAIKLLHTYLHRKSHEWQETQSFLHESKIVRDMNYRQIAIIDHALKNPEAIFTFAIHQRRHNISYQTARTDLLFLVEKNLLFMIKNKHEFIFSARPDLQQYLATIIRDSPTSRNPAS